MAPWAGADTAVHVRASGVPYVPRTMAPQACIYLICTFYVGASLGVPKLLFAKLASLFLALRVAYPVAYALDLDLLRTQLWLTGVYVCFVVAFAGLFPESALPMLGEVVKKR